MRDGRRIIATLYNDRVLLPDEEKPLPLETCHRNRRRRIQTLFGPIEFTRNYRDARRNRSAVESLMFTIKDGFEFGELGRRGIAAVRQELTEKVLAYNCCRIILMKKRRKNRWLEEMKQAA